MRENSSLLAVLDFVAHIEGHLWKKLSRYYLLKLFSRLCYCCIDSVTHLFLSEMGVCSTKVEVCFAFTVVGKCLLSVDYYNLVLAIEILVFINLDYDWNILFFFPAFLSPFFT